MIIGYNFKEQLSDADIDSMMYRKMLNYNDGIFKGCDLSNTSSSISVSEGVVLIAGRIISIVGNESIEVDLESAFCKLILEIDLTKESTETKFKQVSLRILKSISNYPTLTQNDMDNGGNVYQFELAKFKTSSNGISNFTDTRSYLNFESIYDEIRKHIQAIDDESIFVLKSDTNIITAYIDKSYSMSGINKDLYFSNSNVNPENKTILIGDKLSISNGKILIGKNIKKILVSGKMLLDNTTNTTDFFYIRKNNTIISRNDAAGTYVTVSIPPFLVEVEEGDTISIFCNTGTNATIYENTNVTVEVVE